MPHGPVRLPIGPIDLEVRLPRGWPLPVRLVDRFDGRRDRPPWAACRVEVHEDPALAPLDLRSDFAFAWDPTARAFAGASPGWAASIAPDGSHADLSCCGAQPVVDLFVAAFLRVAAAVALVAHGGLMLHGAAAVRPHPPHRAAAFLGRSGAGKTTMRARLPGWTVLADDTIAVWVDGDGARVAGTPFAGSEGHPRSAHAAPLAALYALEPRAAALELTPLAPGAACAELLQHVIWPLAGGPSAAAAILDGAAELLARAPMARLRSALHHDVAAALEEAA